MPAGVDRAQALAAIAAAHDVASRWNLMRDWNRRAARSPNVAPLLATKVFGSLPEAAIREGFDGLPRWDEPQKHLGLQVLAELATQARASWMLDVVEATAKSSGRGVHDAIGKTVLPALRKCSPAAVDAALTRWATSRSEKLRTLEAMVRAPPAASHDLVTALSERLAEASIGGRKLILEQAIKSTPIDADAGVWTELIQSLEDIHESPDYNDAYREPVREALDTTLDTPRGSRAPRGLHELWERLKQADPREHAWAAARATDPAQAMRHVRDGIRVAEARMARHPGRVHLAGTAVALHLRGAALAIAQRQATDVRAHLDQAEALLAGAAATHSFAAGFRCVLARLRGQAAPALPMTPEEPDKLAEAQRRIALGDRELWDLAGSCSSLVTAARIHALFDPGGLGSLASKADARDVARAAVAMMHSPEPGLQEAGLTYLGHAVRKPAGRAIVAPSIARVWDLSRSPHASVARSATIRLERLGDEDVGWNHAVRDLAGIQLPALPGRSG